MKSLLLSTAINAYAPQRYEEEMNKVSECIHLDWNSLYFSFNGGISIKSISGTPIEDSDFVIWRSPGDRLTPHLNIIFEVMKLNSKFVLNSNALNFTEFGSYNKLAQHYFFIKNNLPIIPSIIYTGERVPQDLIDKYIGYPAIFKGIRGGLGQQVEKVNDWNELQKVIKNKKDTLSGNFFIQKYLPIQFDYRIIVLNGKILGAIRRFRTDEDFRTNVAQGGQVEVVNNLSEEMGVLSLNVAKSLNADMCGVDIMSVGDKLFVLECNLSCQFEGFEKETKINVAKEVVDFCVKRSTSVR